MVKYLPTMCMAVISIYSTKIKAQSTIEKWKLYILPFEIIWKINMLLDKFNNRDITLLNKNDKTLQTVIVLDLNNWKATLGPYIEELTSITS